MLRSAVPAAYHLRRGRLAGRSHDHSSHARKSIRLHLDVSLGKRWRAQDSAASGCLEIPKAS